MVSVPDSPAGVYFCRFGADDYRATEKVVLQR